MQYKKDFEMKKDEIKPLLIKGGKILNFTHVDMDGIGANIALSKRLSNVIKIEVNYHDIDDRIRRFNLNEYDAVIFTDICPANSLDYLKDFKNIIILDHHDTALDCHNVDNNVFVYNGISGSKLTHEFIKSMFGESHYTKEIQDLIDIINDYDLWIHANPKSNYFNWLYNKYKSDGFKSRFISGETKLLHEEKVYIQNQAELISKAFNNLELFDFEKVNGAMFFASDYINDLSEMVLNKHKYDFILIVNPTNLSSSIRSVGEFYTGDMLKALGIGGGHKHAGGFRCVDEPSLKRNTEMIEEYAYRFYKFSRK